ncbi:MAG: glycosyltransferase family 2 protein [Acidobacteriota bacterium]
MNAVDVFIVVHNHAATLGATLAGLAAQILRPAALVLIDNASGDGSLRVTEGFTPGLPLEVVRWRDNRGFAAAANEALRRTHSPFVLALNPDCRLAPDYLESLMAACGRAPLAGAATGLLLRAQGERLEETAVVDSAGIVMTRSGRHLDRGAGGRLEERMLAPAWVFGASAAAALYRREALEDAAYPGGEVFDEGFFSYREDADLAWRLQRRGWQCLFWPAARAYHGRGLKPEAARAASPEINRHSVRNRFLLRLANADWRWHAACLPAWLLRDLAVVAACLLRERSSLPGLKEAWAMRRRQHQRGRANAARARVSSWRLAAWFWPGGRVRRVVC